MMRSLLLLGAALLLSSSAPTGERCAVGRVELNPELVQGAVGDTVTFTAIRYSTCGAVQTTGSVAFSETSPKISFTAQGTRQAEVVLADTGVVYFYVTAETKKDSSRIEIDTALTPPIDSFPPDTTDPPADTVISDPIGEIALQADSFVSTISVQTHFGQAAVYNDNFPTVRSRLIEMGVRHVRQQMFSDGASQAKLSELGDSGIKLTAGCWPVGSDYSDASHCISRANAIGTTAIDAFDGWNEVDNRDVSGSWPNAWVAWQTTLFTAINASGTWQNRPVLGSSVSHASDADAVASASPSGAKTSILDYGNLHSYPSSSGIPSNVSNSWIPQWNKIDGGKKDFVTETGYHTCTACTTSPGVSKQAQSKYAGRLFFEYFNRNILRTNWYEFVDQGVSTTEREKNWGLLQSNYIRKASFHTVKNIITLLKDPGTSFAPGKLNYTLSNKPTALHHTLLQKRNGRFYLVLWNEVKVWNTATKADVGNAEIATTLSFPTAKSSIKTFRPTGLNVDPDGSTAAVTTATGVAAVALHVPDHVLIVEIIP
jgi:hypothetical protein